MEREVIENSGMEHFAEIGLVIFVAVFILIILRAIFLDKDHSEKMGQMPLDDTDGVPSDDEPAEVTR